MSHGTRNEHPNRDIRGRAADLVAVQTETVVSREIVKKQAGTVTVFAFDRGQGLSEHSAPFDALVMVLEGRGRIRIGGEDHELQAGEIIVMPANVPHAVEAPEPFKMLLVMIRSQE